MDKRSDAKTIEDDLFSWAKYASAIGAATALVFVIWWFREAGHYCAFVRFYEQVFGGLFFVGWLVGTASGLKIASIGRRRRLIPSAVVGCLLVVFVNVGLLVASASVVFDTYEKKMTFKTNRQLLTLLNVPEKSRGAAHMLGERGVVTAVPLLVALLEDDKTEMNLRYNTVIALGKICAGHRCSETDTDRVLSALTRMLQYQHEGLPGTVAEALGRIGDSRSIGPLASFILDSSYSTYTRRHAVIALGMIGGDQAHAVLKSVREQIDDEYLRNSITQTLNSCPPL